MKKRGLDSIDTRLLYELDRGSDETTNELGAKLKVPRETVAFRLKRLVENEYIKRFLTIINISQLNLFYYKFFYKFHKTTPAIEKSIITYLKEHRGVAYLAGLEGRYDLTFLVIARGIQDLKDFIVPFKKKFGAYVLEQEILTMTAVHRFNFRFFERGGALLHSAYPEELITPTLDPLDYRIVRELAKNARANLTALAKKEKVHLNVIRYRIEKLKKANVLGPAIIELDFKKFDVEQYQIAISLKDHSTITDIIAFVAAFPESTFATITLGKYDLALEFAVHSTEELKTIVDRIKNKFSEAIISHDIFVMNEHSINWFPIPESWTTTNLAIPPHHRSRRAKSANAVK